MVKLTAEEEAFQALLEGEAGEPTPELRRLAAMARALDAPRPAPRPEFRAALRARLLTEAARRRSLVARGRERLAAWNEAWRRSLRVVAVTAAAAILLAAGGAVLAAAEGSLPGQALHGVKRWRERVHVAVTAGDRGKGLVLLDQARERMAEMYGLSAAGETEGALYVRTLGDMDAATVDAATRLVRAYRDTAERELMDRLGGFASEQRLDLVGIMGQLPAEARPAARDSITLVERIEDQVYDVLAGCPCPANPLAPTAGTTPPPAGPLPAAPVRCACEEQPTGGLRQDPGDDGSDGGDPDPSDPDPEDPGPEEPEDPNTLPDLDGTDLDDTAEELIEDLIEPLPSLSPSPSPLPSLT